MSSETDVAPAGAAEKKEDAPAKPRRQARGNPTHPGTRAGADQKKTGHGAGGHAGEPPPTIRPKTKPRPSQSPNAVKRVGHAEGEARSAQGGAALAPGSRSPRRSYRTSVQTGVLTVTPDMSFTGSHPPVPAADAGTASPAPAKAKPPSHRPSHRPPTTPAEIAGAAIAAGAAGAAGTAAAEAKAPAAPAAAAPPAPQLRPAVAPAPSAATIVAPGGIEAAGTPAPSK
ncbi:MAG: hypothetical protein LBL01_00440, partial [Bifidobacteriaceae bacterium]|nr:hypothetical protein [Bifidobacteriaceae bacterium]